MPLTKRYMPEHPAGDSTTFGFSFDGLFPKGVGITAELAVYTNMASPEKSDDFAIGPVGVQGRTVYATLGGGVSGQDYQLRWTATGTDKTVVTRTALILCAQTS